MSNRTKTDRWLRSLMAGCVGLVLAAAPAAAQTFAIQGGTVHPMDGGDPFVGTVVIENGRIAQVGPDVQAPADAEVVDATGQHVYPGMFDAVSRLGLTEIGAVDVTNDARELGRYNPHLQAATAIHPATEHIPVTRANGITHTMAAPQGGVISGQASLVGLDGWTVEEMQIDPGAAMVINFPSVRTREFDFSTFTVIERSFREAQEEYRERLGELNRWLEAGRQYAEASGVEDVERDLRLEAMARVASGEMKVLLGASGERNIRNAVAWAEEEGLDYVLTGGGEAWKVADLLVEHDVPVILGPTQSTPSGTDEAYDEAYTNPVKLHEAGVRFAFATFNSSSARTLPYEAAMGVPFGLPREVAMEAITRNGAEFLGFGDRLGTIEPGKLGNVIVTDGDPLEIQTRVNHLFILGRKVSTDNKHRSLYEKYRSRPKPRVIS